MLKERRRIEKYLGRGYYEFASRVYTEEKLKKTHENLNMPSNSETREVITMLPSEYQVTANNERSGFNFQQQSMKSSRNPYFLSRDWIFPLDIGCKLNVYKTYRSHPLNVLYMLKLHSLSSRSNFVRMQTLVCGRSIQGLLRITFTALYSSHAKERLHFSLYFQFIIEQDGSNVYIADKQITDQVKKEDNSLVDILIDFEIRAMKTI